MSASISTYQTDRQKLGIKNTTPMSPPLLHNDNIAVMLRKLDSISEQNSQHSAMIQRDILSLSHDVKKIKETNKLYIAGIVASVVVTGIALAMSSHAKLL